MVKYFEKCPKKFIFNVFIVIEYGKTLRGLLYGCKSNSFFWKPC
jgi:hypothetical protein